MEMRSPKVDTWETQIRKGSFMSDGAGMRSAGAVAMCIGTLWAAAAFSSDVFISSPAKTVGEGEYAINVPASHVFNLSLANQRASHLIASGVLVIVGTLLYGFGRVVGVLSRPPEAESAAVDHLPAQPVVPPEDERMPAPRLVMPPRS